LQDEIEVIIDLEGHEIDGDIRLHVQKRLEKDKRLRMWPLGIKNEIRDALVEGAHGM
jgi:hypothetical protein